MGKDIAEVKFRLVQMHALDGVGDLAAVLVVHANVGATSLNGLGRIVNVAAVKRNKKHGIRTEAQMNEASFEQKLTCI